MSYLQLRSTDVFQASRYHLGALQLKLELVSSALTVEVADQAILWKQNMCGGSMTAEQEDCFVDDGDVF